ncbi:MAG: hypothetical protein HQL69_00195 [Magnetococcales bacterium]|nr:hypothetical protein [Magnetococcales bacterium]
MDINVVMGISQQATAMASRSPGRADPVEAGGKATSNFDVEDKASLFGMDSINRAIKELKAQEPLTIPEPVGKAIRDMANEFLDQLPTVETVASQRT